MISPELKVGLSKSIQKTITDDDTSKNFGSGVIQDFLATPSLAALMIEAAAKVVDPLLLGKHISVGKILNINHLHPSIKGSTVTVNAMITAIENNKIIFEITAYDELGQIGIGHHERHIVNNDILKRKVEERTEILQPRPQ